MKPAAINTPRRIFFAVIVVLVLVLAWNLSKPWRTGIQEHHIDYGSKLDRMFGRSQWLDLGTNVVWWAGQKQPSDGFLYRVFPHPHWQFALCARTNLIAVTERDARSEFFGDQQDGSKAFGKDWQTGGLIIHEKQILLLRHSTDTQTVYALEVVEQQKDAVRFRSRKILPAPNNDAAGRHP